MDCVWVLVYEGDCKGAPPTDDESERVVGVYATAELAYARLRKAKADIVSRALAHVTEAELPLRTWAGRTYSAEHPKHDATVIGRSDAAALKVVRSGHAEILSDDILDRFFYVCAARRDGGCCAFLDVTAQRVQRE
jgi:hypothetical protein